jgi:hypothetical protein
MCNLTAPTEWCGFVGLCTRETSRVLLLLEVHCNFSSLEGSFGRELRLRRLVYSGNIRGSFYEVLLEVHCNFSSRGRFSRLCFELCCLIHNFTNHCNFSALEGVVLVCSGLIDTNHSQGTAIAALLKDFHSTQDPIYQPRLSYCSLSSLEKAVFHL